MPTATERGMSALSGFGLFMTFILFCYLNTTTSAFFWSTIYAAGSAIIMLATAAKWAAALGVENKLSKAADYVASLVPWIALYFTIIQALHVKHDGMDGAMAIWSIGTLAFLLCFGLFDSVGTLLGQKYKQAQDALHEASDRASAIANAARGQQRQQH